MHPLIQFKLLYSELFKSFTASFNRKQKCLSTCSIERLLSAYFHYSLDNIFPGLGSEPRAFTHVSKSSSELKQFDFEIFCFGFSEEKIATITHLNMIIKWLMVNIYFFILLLNFE